MDHSRTRTESMHRYPVIMRSKTADHTKRPTPRPRAQTYDVTSPLDKSWNQLAQTYTWVVQQEYAKLEKKNKKTEKWVIEQLELVPDRSNGKKGKIEVSGTPQRKKTWEELMGGYEVEADKWMRQEAEARRAAIEREKEKARAIEKDIRRIQARVQQKKDNERQRLAEERLKAAEAQKVRAKQERARANVASADVWRTYEARWANIANHSESLTFRTIPWPLVSRPTSAKDIMPAEITAFLLSPLHSQSQTRKDRIRSALLRWHPDRFRKYLLKVVEEDREAVEEGAGIVARVLNDLSERENRVSRREFHGSV